jgi:hypothetical protein
VGVHDNFFDLGGHSLLLVRVYSKLHALFHTDISIVDLFKYPTISALTAYLGQKSPANPSLPNRAEALAALNAGKDRLKQLYQQQQRIRNNREGAR